MVRQNSGFFKMQGSLAYKPWWVYINLLQNTPTKVKNYRIFVAVSSRAENDDRKVTKVGIYAVGHLVML